MTETRHSYRSVLAVAEFRGLFLAELLSVAGDQVARIAVALLVYGRTGSAFLASATYAASFLTSLVAGPVLATYADRYPRRGLMIGCDVARAVAASLLLLPGIPIATVFGVLVALSALSSPFEAARSALLPEVLGEEAYRTGNALQNSVFTGGQVVGLAAGGALVAGIGLRGAFVVDVLSFVGSAVVIAASIGSRPATQASEGASSVFAQTAAGWRLVAGDPQLVWLLSVACIGAVVAIETAGLAVPIASAVGGGPVAAGVLSAALPAGYVIGAYLLTRQPDKRPSLPVLLAASALPLTLSPFVGTTWGLTLLWVAAGVASALQVLANAAFVLAVPPELRGRAFGLAMAVLMGSQGLALLLGGVLADSVDPRRVVALFALVGLISVPALILWRPERVRPAQARHATGRDHA